MMLPEEDRLLKRRFAELAGRAFQRGLYTYTGFLSLHELSLLRAEEHRLAAPFALFGGLPGCERQMARFGGQGGEADGAGFPICCLMIRPLQQRFADALSHRDMLGALMSLGIERDTLGDIILRENVGYLFCTEAIAPFIEESLSQVKHTSVSCRKTEAPLAGELFTLSPLRIQVQSPRADAVVAKAYNLSREGSLELFRAGRIFRNGAVLENNSAALAEGDLISVRGLGRFIYRGIEGSSKKGKLNLRIEKYV